MRKIHLINDLTPAKSCAAVNAHYAEAAKLPTRMLDLRFIKARGILLKTGRAIEKGGVLVPVVE